MLVDDVIQVFELLSHYDDVDELVKKHEQVEVEIDDEDVKTQQQRVCKCNRDDERLLNDQIDENVEIDDIVYTLNDDSDYIDTDEVEVECI